MHHTRRQTIKMTMKRPKIAGTVRVSILGIPLDLLKPEDVAIAATSMIESDSPCHIMMVEWWDIFRSWWRKNYRLALQRAALVIPVSRALVRGANFLYHQKFTAHEPFEFVIRLLSQLEKINAPIGLLGLRSHLIQTIEQRITETYPNIRVVLRYSGYFSRNMEHNLITAMKKSAPLCVLAGDGIPHKDLWFASNKKNLPHAILLWSAQVMNIFAGLKSRPRKKLYIFRTCGRLLRNPLRIFRFPFFIFYSLYLFFYKIFGKRTLHTQIEKIDKIEKMSR